ncbi:hypothetical protein ACFSQ0_00300 [Mesonia sediminis]|uniref:KTSC domain-containing protein n=1 Tax=Mesonia sediminis TaxID=1703946 RepID=A0ABW5S9D6_9FLAO
MKKIWMSVLGCLMGFMLQAQDCDELMDYVKTQDYGTTYSSPLSDAVTKVTFYEVTIDYRTHYFAIVCFKSGYIGCDEYIYKVGSTTQTHYAVHYLNSAGKAFWKYIRPYHKNLKCSPSFE